MPAKTTVKKAKNGTVYVYLTTRAYRDAKGRPTSDEALIGKLAPDQVSLIPNQRYGEFFGTPPQGIVESSVGFGDAATLWLLADRLGITRGLEATVGGLTSAVVTVASYMVGHGNVMCHIDSYCEENWTPADIRLDSPRTTELFTELDFPIRAGFFRYWISLRQEDEYIAYDVTSVSTYAGGIEDAEWGHNRDQEELTQVNLGMFLGETTRLPVYYATYQGSVLDKTHLPVMMESAKALGITRVRFVFDRGFVTKDNLTYVADNHLSFVTALPITRVIARELIDQCAADIHSSLNRVLGENIYAWTQPTRIDGLDLNAHVFYSPYKAAGEEEILYAKLARLEHELAAMESSPRVTKRYRDYFTVATHPGDIAFTRDHTKIDTRLAHAGYFILITNDHSLTPVEVLRTYRDKDIIEKAFSQLKNHLDFHRMRTHYTHTSDGKLFTAFIALILRSAIREALSASADTARMSVGTAMRELHKLKRVTYHDGTILHTIVTKTQRQILTALDIDPHILTAMN